MDKRRSSVNAEKAILLVALKENWALLHILKICGKKILKLWFLLKNILKNFLSENRKA